MNFEDGEFYQVLINFLLSKIYFLSKPLEYQTRKYVNRANPVKIRKLSGQISDL